MDGFETYVTTVGGSGYGVLLSRSDLSKVVEAEGGAERATLPDVGRFRGAQGSELADWSSSAGQWAFV